MLFATNYKPGTILSGWDNLHPEFDFGLNIQRSIFAVWQEFQGLGLLGGMGHASDLPRQIFLLILSLVLPTDSLRYIWTFLMLFTGSAGAYYLIKHVLSWNIDFSNHLESRIKNQELREDKTVIRNSYFLLPFLGACFYLLNLATVQMFYTPFEAFSAFFGFLPWLLLASLLYFNSTKKTAKKYLLFLAIVLLFATTSWYVQTFFIVFVIALSIMLLPSTLLSLRGSRSPSGNAAIHSNRFLPAGRQGFNFVRNDMKKIFKLYSIIFLINCFWLLPVAYFTLTSSQVNLNSKINQMATESIFLQNQEFGTVPDVMLLKGFLFKSVDPDSNGTTTYMLSPWINHLQNPFVVIIGYLLFTIVFIGFIKSIRSKNSALQGFSWLFIFTFISLAIDTFPFSFINTIFRNYLPLVNQIFRFPYTKFVTLASLVFAVLFAVGIQRLITFFENSNIKPSLPAGRNSLKIANLKMKINYQLMIPLIPLVLLILFALPSFQGHLIYDKERTVIPQDYQDLFTFFKHQDPNTRIADFPDSNFWGWNFYQWQKPRRLAEAQTKADESYGYGGSGFLWYGINQPILDRNFDVWSQTDENYYYELSQAIYSKNSVRLENVLNKYQVTWLLIDKSVFDNSSIKALFIPEIEDLLNNSTYVKKEAEFGKLEVYKVTLKESPKSFVLLSSNLPSVNQYNWSNNDQAYSDLGNYISTDSQIGNWKLEIGNSLTYPFRSLFSLKTQKEKEFSITEEKTSLSLTTKVKTQAQTKLIVPSFVEKETIVPVELTTQKTDTGTPLLIAKVLLPQIFLGAQEITRDIGPSFPLQLPAVKPDRYPLKININGAGTFTITNEDKDLGIAFFTLNSKNNITLSDKDRTGISEILFSPEIFSQLKKAPQTIELDPNQNATLTVRFPKIEDHYVSFHPQLTSINNIRNCDNFRGNSFSGKNNLDGGLELMATDADACTSFFAQNLPHDQSYAIFINSTHIDGESFRFWIENTNQQYAPIDTYLPKDTKPVTSSFILPPMEQFGTSYAFHFDNVSIGRHQTVNKLNSLSVYPLFYNYLNGIQIHEQEITPATSMDNSNLNVSHPNESLYIISLNPETRNLKPTLILSQSFNPGWHAYRVQGSGFRVQEWLNQAFPFVFGREIKNHAEVNNWENGWILSDQELGTKNQELIVVYLPQYLEYIGFGMVLVTFTVLIFGYKRAGKAHHNLPQN
ncbi:MAG TPA: hypothetical protein VLG67_01340 [Candidatus Saccharimonadales bacterium]|nr:hypothetical protein [Candidatus Saccharimonadales bacterium]